MMDYEDSEYRAKAWIEMLIEHPLSGDEWQDYRDLCAALAAASPFDHDFQWRYIKANINAGWRPDHGADSLPLSTQLIQWQAARMDRIRSEVARAFEEGRRAVDSAIATISPVIDQFWKDVAAIFKPADGEPQPPRLEARNVNPKRRHWESPAFTPARKRGRKR